MSAFPVPMIGRHGTVHSIPTVKCKLKETVKYSLTSEVQLIMMYTNERILLVNDLFEKKFATFKIV